jgi:hypothetical protein
MASTGSPTDDTSQPSTPGGLLGMLSGLAKATDPMLLINVGAGLIAGSKYGSNAGEGLLQGLQSYQQQKTAKLNNQLQSQQIQQGQLGLQRQQMLTGAMQQAMGGQQPAPGGAPPGLPQGGLAGMMPPGGSQDAQPFLPGISQMPPQGGAPAQAPPQQPQGLPAGLQPPTMDQVYGSSYPGGMDPRLARVFALGSQDPNAALNQNRTEQLKLAQQQYAPTIARLDQLIKSDAPAKYMNGTGYADVKQAWPQMATALGMDPDKDMNDSNVRLALSHVRNQLSSSLQEPTSEPPMPLRTIKLPDGRMAQVEPGTGKVTPIASEKPQQVIGANGQPTLVPEGQSYGMTPFNQVTYGTAQMSGGPGALLAAMAAKGVSLPAGLRSQQQQIATLNGLMAANPGKSPDEIADLVRTGQLDFSGAKRSTGQLSGVLAAANAQSAKLEKDFAQIEPLVANLPNAPNVFNRVFTGLKNNLSFGGDKDSAQLVLYLREAATEYAKLSSGATGAAAPAEGNIKDAVEIFHNAFTQGGYQGLKEAMIQSAQNKRDAYREGLQTAAAPGFAIGGGGQASSAAPPARNAQGWTLHQDAKGNRAYVSPDGKQFQEVH